VSARETLQYVLAGIAESDHSLGAYVVLFTAIGVDRMLTIRCGVSIEARNWQSSRWPNSTPRRSIFAAWC
jgi:hypothetical protein